MRRLYFWRIRMTNDFAKMDKLMENLSNGFSNFYRTAYGKNPPDVDHVIFNGQATIVFWEDGKKTVVKRKMDDPDNKNLAIMYAIMKRILGSTSAVNRYINKTCL
nr:MAG TPA: hypothetical protein [Bacteriophage sp.]